LARDPRDIIISSCLYQWYKNHKPNINNFNEALEKVKLKEYNCESIPVHSLETIRINGNDLTLEELKSLHIETNEMLCDFICNISNDWLIYKYEDLVDDNFVTLNKYLDTNIDSNVEVPKEENRVTRSKAYGNWRDWFTQKDVEFYKPLYDDYMQLMNYDTNDWKLNENPVLPPELGSEYMEKLFYGNL